MSFSSALSKATNGEKKASVKASTVKTALERLTVKYGDAFQKRLYDEKGRPRKFINLYVNGRDIRFLSGLDTELREGDEIQILPAITGG